MYHGWLISEWMSTEFEWFINSNSHLNNTIDTGCVTEQNADLLQIYKFTSILNNKHKRINVFFPKLWLVIWCAYACRNV